MSLPIKTVIFVEVPMLIQWISRNSLRSFRSHGFYHFFAREAILLIILIKVEYWFKNPFSPPQIISWICLVLSLV